MSGLTEDIAMLANDNPFDGSGSPDRVRRLGYREAARVALTRARNDVAMAVQPPLSDEVASGMHTAWLIINRLVLEMGRGDADAPSRP